MTRSRPSAVLTGMMNVVPNRDADRHDEEQSKSRLGQHREWSTPNGISRAAQASWPFAVLTGTASAAPDWDTKRRCAGKRRMKTVNYWILNNIPKCTSISRFKMYMM